MKPKHVETIPAEEVPEVAPQNPTPDVPVSPAPSAVPTHRFRSAFESVASEIAAVPPKDYLPINIDISSSVMIVLGREAELATFRDQIKQNLPTFDIQKLDKVVTYALALAFAQTRFAATTKVAPIPELIDELTKARETLVSDVTALAKRNYLDGSRLSELRGTNGHKNLVFDALLLCTILRDNWSTISGKTGVQMEELDHTESLTDQLAVAVAQKEQGTNNVGPSSETRLQAFALFMRTYNQVRRAIGYLRWDQDDAEKYAPSLYAGRGGRRKDPTQTDPSTTTPDSPQAPPRVPDPSAGPPAIAAPASPLQATSAGQSVTNGSAKPAAAPLGMPGNDPLGRV